MNSMTTSTAVKALKLLKIPQSITCSSSRKNSAAAAVLHPASDAQTAASKSTSKKQQKQHSDTRSSALQQQQQRERSNVSFNNSRVTLPFDHNMVYAASYLMRNLEKEFDMVRHRMDQNINRMFRLQDTDSSNVASGVLSSADVAGSVSDLGLATSAFSDNDLILVDKAGNRRFFLTFDMRNFEPNEIHVKTENSCLTVSAKSEKQDLGEYYLSEFSQSYMLPKDLCVDKLTSKWVSNTLVIEAELPRLAPVAPPCAKPLETFIPIEHAIGGHEACVSTATAADVAPTAAAVAAQAKADVISREVGAPVPKH